MAFKVRRSFFTFCFILIILKTDTFKEEKLNELDERSIGHGKAYHSDVPCEIYAGRSLF